MVANRIMEAHDGEAGEITPHGGEAVKEIANIPLDLCVLSNLVREGSQHLARGDRESSQICLVHVEVISPFVSTHGCVYHRVEVYILPTNGDGDESLGCERC